MVEVSGSPYSSGLSEFSRKQRELQRKPCSDKNNRKLYRFSYVHDMENFFARIVECAESANSNIISEF